MGVLDGQTAFILGASAGIAQASAKLLAVDGATLYLLGRSQSRLEATRDGILAVAPNAEIVIQKGDPEDEDTVRRAAQSAYDVQKRLNIVIGTVASGVPARWSNRISRPSPTSSWVISDRTSSRCAIRHR